MPIISAVGLFCYDKFEGTPNEKVVNILYRELNWLGCFKNAKSLKSHAPEG